jgi:hypothetical protein
MMGRNILMYFPWSRPNEDSAPLGVLDNRFGALFELRRLQWPKFEALADIERFNQGIAGFLDNILLENYSLFREDMRIRAGNAVRIIERCASDGKVMLLDGDFLDGVDILIIVSFDSQPTDQHPGETELAAVRKFLADPSHTLFVCPHHDIGSVVGLPSNEVLQSQEVEFHHHGDLGLPGQQRLGGFARSLLRRRIHSPGKEGRPSTRCCSPNPTSLQGDYSYATPPCGLLRTAGWAASVNCGPT